MRDYPWHLPSVSVKQFQRFRNLAALHDLTLSWLRELRMEREPHLMTRGENRQVAENLWMLAPLSETRMDLLLDEPCPDEMLSKLEYTVWTVQAWTLANLLQRAAEESERQSLESILEMTSWRLGRQFAETKWKDLRLPPGQELRAILLALVDTPFGPRDNSGDMALIRRSLPRELEVEWLCCPHRVEFPDVVPIADRLCHLHSHWVRGFVYALSSAVTTSDRVTEDSFRRCTQRLFLEASSS